MEEPATDLREKWVQELHRATENFHEARRAWEQALEASDYRHEDRVNEAHEVLQKREREVEEIEERIKKELATDVAVRPGESAGGVAGGDEGKP